MPKTILIKYQKDVSFQIVLLCDHYCQIQSCYFKRTRYINNKMYHKLAEDCEGGGEIHQSK